MKKFILKFIGSLILTLILQGCMPDSLTKFKSEAPKKTATTSSSPPTAVVDASGTAVVFTHPTFFYYGADVDSKLNAKVGSAINAIGPILDGSLNDSSVSASFLLGCSLVTSGNSQTITLPTGLMLNTSSCYISGTSTINKSVVTPFCSDLVSGNQTMCESKPFVWDSSTNTCSNSDFQYSNQADCEAGFNFWYSAGEQLPYKLKLSYKNTEGTVYNIFTTIRIGSYTLLTSLNYTQSEKLTLPTTTSASIYNSIVPIRTTASTSGNYLAANIITSQAGIQGVVNYADSAQNLIAIRKIRKITLSSATSFSTSGFISASSGSKVGKIFKKDPNNTNIIYVENISSGEAYFDVGNILDNAATYVSAKAIITAIDDSILFNTSTSTNLDNELQYYNSKITITSDPANSYLVNSLTNIKDIKPTTTVALNNAIVFSISPRLPDGLTLNTSTGAISGIFLKALPITTYTIKATNPLGEISNILKLTASDAPADLSLSTRQIITVSSTAFFTEGEALHQAVTPPLLDAAHGKILKILNGSQMAIDTTNDSFLANASLDSGSGFFSEKAYVIPDNSCVNTIYTNQADCELNSSTWSIGPIFYNVALKLNRTSSYYQIGTCSDVTYTTQATCEDNLKVWGPTHVSSVTGAKGIVAGIFTAANDILFVRHVTQAATGVSTAKNFSQGDVLVGDGRIVNEIDSNFIKMDLTFNGSASNIDFLVSADVTSTDTAIAVQAGGYTYNKSGNTIFVSDITKSPSGTLFKRGDRLYNNENTSGTYATVAGVTHDIRIVLERGKKIFLNTSISAGNSLFTIDPALPAGVTLNTLTGAIAGTPTTATLKKDYTLTATNFVGQTTYVFSMEVRDYFSVSEDSGASSFLMHKIGASQVDRKCRINANDIISNSGALLDIRCHLEGQEEDLYFNPIKLQASTGPGVCQYIQYSPYYFWQYSPVQTASGTAYTYITGCKTPTAYPTSELLCPGNYKAKDGPNCDEGNIDVTTEVWAMNTAATPACVQSSTSLSKLDCGGKKTNCITGPVKDLLSDTEVQSGFRSKIYQSPNGINQTWTLSSPISKTDKGNMRVANSTKNNMCSTSNIDVNTWTSKAAGTLSTTAPFGKTSPFYVVSCLNAANQVKARIRVVVRDWDESFKVNDGIELDSPLGKMNSSGLDQYNNLYNNYNDWDNAYDTVLPAASYTGGTCGVIGTGKEYAFPKDNL